MKSIWTKLGLLLAVALMASCAKDQSIQKYYVESQEKSDFIAVDVPASIIQLGEEASEETKATMATIKKLNVLAFQVNDENRTEFEKEITRVKKILKADRYNELMRMKHEGINVMIKYQGDDEAVDEFILFAADDSKGFALARVLGDKMEPAKIMKMMDDIKDIDAEGTALTQLEGIFKDFGE